MNTTLTAAQRAAIFQQLNVANQAFTDIYPGDSDARQPIHTVYGGAQLFKADTTQKMGAVALRALETYAPTFIDFGQALHLPGYEDLPTAEAEKATLQRTLADDPIELGTQKTGVQLAYTVYQRVQEKLAREPIEDFRIDFEDGYGNRPDAEEDAEAARTAQAVAQGLAAGTLPPFLGIRIKPFNAELAARSMRTLDLFLTTLLQVTNGRLPDHFVVTLPKVTVPAHVSALVDAFELLEAQTALASGSLKLELMIETPQSIFDAKGESALPTLVQAARGRCVAAHFGVYDYTALCNVTAAYQHMRHPVCDFARHMMQVALAGTGIWLSDGATNIMPVAPHRASDRARLTPVQQQANRDAVHAAWRTGYNDIQHSLRHGYYQGWDLHPAQLSIRYAAVYAFFLVSLDAASSRLKAFMDKAAQATLLGNVFDDAATGQGLLNFFLRGLNCGAITTDEALQTGLTLAEFRSRSFVKILDARRTQAGPNA